MQLGKYETNNVYCADSYKAIKELPDKCVDCIYIDIPYLFQDGGCSDSPLSQRAKKLRTIELADIKNGIDYSIFDDMLRIMKMINIFIWCNKEQIPDILNYWLKQREKINFEILVWVKDNPTPLTNNIWLPDVEYCLYFREKGVPLNDGYNLKSKWYESPINKRDKDKFSHPTIKSIELVKRHLEHTTRGGQIVADFFMGSGTTCVACKDLGREYIGFEIEEKWYKIAKDRLEGTDASGQMSFILR